MAEIVEALKPKTLDDYFSDWEGSTFGFGYGTGEPHIIPALRKFFELTPESASHGSYDYAQLERELGATVAWLLINILARVGVLEYGTSPRYAWLTPKGQRLREFMLSKSSDELVSLACRDNSDYVTCYPDTCNCGPEGYVKGRVCQNPFFLDRINAPA